MEMRNLGVVDRYIRLTGGLLLVGSALTSRKRSLLQGTALAFGAMKIAEGATGWCPLMQLVGITDTRGTVSNNPKTASAQKEESRHQESKSQHTPEPGSLESRHNGGAHVDTPSTTVQAADGEGQNRHESDVPDESEADAVNHAYQ